MANTKILRHIEDLESLEFGDSIEGALKIAKPYQKETIEEFEGKLFYEDGDKNWTYNFLSRRGDHIIHILIERDKVETNDKGVIIQKPNTYCKYWKVANDESDQYLRLHFNMKGRGL